MVPSRVCGWFSDADTASKTTQPFLIPVTKILGISETDEQNENDLDYMSRFALRAIREAGFPYFVLLLLVLYYFAWNLLLGLVRTFFAIFCAPIFEALNEGNAASSTKGGIEREGFAEDETTYAEQSVKWRDARICPGYQLGDHPEWRELLKGLKWINVKRMSPVTYGNPLFNSIFVLTSMYN